MIASLPSLPVDPKAPEKPRSPAPPDAPPAPDFSDFIKALSDLLNPTPGGKTPTEKSASKASPSAAPSADPDFASLAATLPLPPAPPPPPLAPTPPSIPAHDQLNVIPITKFGKAGVTANQLSADAKLGQGEGSPQTALKPVSLEKEAKNPKSDTSSEDKPAPPPSGMTVAPKEERMKFQVEKNEIAGPVTQKLPTTGSVSSAAVVAAPASTAKLRVPVDFSGRDNSIEQFTINNASKAAVETSAPAAPALSPADRVEQLISREVVSFKSSGADHVGVALKIDAHTQLFLELSYRDGQTQAVLRCDKGDLPAFTAHFGQLQESLARQNIQLQPSSQGASLGGNNTSGGQRQQQAPAADYAAAEPVRPVAIKKSKTATFSRQGWESWA